MISKWKKEYEDQMTSIFKRGKTDAEKELKLEKESSEKLEKLVGQLTYEVDWLKKVAICCITLKKNLNNSASKSERHKMFDSTHPRLSLSRQAVLLDVNRNSFYQKDTVAPKSEENLMLMKLIDQIHTDFPTWSYRKIAAYIRNLGIQANRKRIRRLMRKMDVYAIYPGQNLSKLLHAEYRMPYLLRNLKIERPDQVWGVDITYLPMEKGFMYLFVIIDWYSRNVVDYELSPSLEKTFVMNCLKRALSRRTPEIINSDQGSHFTNSDYIQLLKSHGVRISMDGKGQATDNARTERFFRTLKYDCVYINEFDTPRDLRAAINSYMEAYNFQRPNQAINNQTPANIYLNCGVKAAA